MSVTVSISIYVEPGSVSNSFHALLKRLQSSAVIKKVRVHEKNFDVGVQPLHSWHEKLNPLIETIPTSNKMLELRIDYKLSSGEVAGMDLVLRGCSYERGFELSVNGPISLLISESQVNHQLENILEHPNEKVFAEHITSRSVTALKDWEEIFFRVSGVDELYTIGFGAQHVAMYLESGWPSPVCCAMLYHHDIREFARDFIRIYREYNFGDEMPKMLSNEFDLDRIDLSAQYKSQAKRSERLYYKQFDDPNGGSLLDFLKKLDLDNARKLAELPENRIRELLLYASKHVRGVNYKDISSQGGALISEPFSSVWPIYCYIADMSISQ